MVTSASETRGGNRWAAVVVLMVLLWTGLLLARVVSAPDSTLITRTVDDAYYYIEVAKSLSRGQPLSFDDGLTTTTGFHPGYMLLLAGLFRVVSPADTFHEVRALLALSGLLHLLTAIPIYLLVRRMTRGWVAVAAACLWLLNPKTLAVNSEGVESALYGLVIASCLLAFDMLLTETRPPLVVRPRTLVLAAMLGIALGLGTLARTDGVTLIVASLTVLAMMRRRNPALAALLAMVLCGVLIAVSPWVAYIWRLTGSIIQDSGAMKHLWRSAQVSDLGALARVKFSLLIARRYLLWSYESIPLLGLLAGLGCGVLFGSGEKERVAEHQAKTERMIALAGVALLNVLLLAGVYATLFDGVRVWYCVPAAVGGTVGLSLLLETAVARVQACRRRRLASWVGAALAVVVAGVYLEEAHDVATGPGRSRHQAYTYQAALWVRDNLPAEARLGAFNAGIWREFCGHTVINLDGVINGNALRHLQRRQLPEYVVGNVDYVADYDYVLRYFEWFGRVGWAEEHLVPVRLFPGEMENSRLVLWRVEQ